MRGKRWADHDSMNPTRPLTPSFLPLTHSFHIHEPFPHLSRKSSTHSLQSHAFTNSSPRLFISPSSLPHTNISLPLSSLSLLYSLIQFPPTLIFCHSSPFLLHSLTFTRISPSLTHSLTSLIPLIRPDSLTHSEREHETK